MHATEFVDSYFAAWNQGDPKSVADHLAADGIYRDIPQNAQRSHDELITSLGEFFSRYPHRYELVGDILTNGDTVAFQYKIFPPECARNDESSATYRGAEFITMYDGIASTITDYYDIPGIPLPSNIARVTSRESRKQKYAKSGLHGEQLVEFKRRLEHIMKSRQTFLMPDLTLPKLAETVGCSVNHLSQVINSGCGMSFFDYVNRFRVEHAKILLSKRDSHGDAVLDIAFRVGFNSNSAFYAAFKKRVGQTPAHYRRLQLKNIHTIQSSAL